MLNTKKIEAALSALKMSKTKLCSRLGIARSTLDAILNGADAKISTVESIAKELGLSMGFLFDETPAEHYEQHGEKNVMAKTIEKLEMDNRTVTNVDEKETEIKAVTEEVVLPQDCPDDAKLIIDKLTSEISYLNRILAEKDIRIEERNETIADLRERIKELKDK